MRLNTEGKPSQGDGNPGNAAVPVPTFYDDLRETYAQSWNLLRLGVADRRSLFHTPTLASLRGDGAPSLRTVVLRDVDCANRLLRFHTDIRSAKLREIAADPRVALHFYDPGQKVQLRVDGQARVHTHDVYASEAWRKTRSFGRLCYSIEPAPGVPLVDPRVARMSADGRDGDGGWQNFAAVSVLVEAVEWLYLAARGHRRARFWWRDGELRATWLAP